MIHRSEVLGVCDTPNRRDAIPVLRRLDGISQWQRGLGSSQNSKVLLDPLQRFVLVEVTRDDQHGIVGPIILAVKRTQTIDRDPLDIAAVADGGLSIVVPLISCREHALLKDPNWVVLSLLKFAPHDRKLLLEVFAKYLAVDQSVGF